MKWEGREAFIYTEPVSELKKWIPSFDRVPFKLHNGGTNKYLDNIIRQSLSTDAEFIRDRQDIPVGVATKRYHLFQHQDVFQALVGGLRLSKLSDTDIQSLVATLKIKEYGESMWVSFTLANHQLNEASHFPFLLEVSGLNTVLAGKALDVRLSWYEPQYRTRIPFGMLTRQEVKFKKISIKKAKALDSVAFTDEIISFLLTHFDIISGERELYNRWINAEVSQHTLAGWIDMTVKNKWNYELAARAYNIAINGYDIQVKKLADNDNDQDTERRKKYSNPSQLTRYLPAPRFYERKKDAPAKFAPARNAFDVSLALSWLLSQQNTIPKQLKWVEIPELMEALVAADEKLRFSLKA